MGNGGKVLFQEKNLVIRVDWVPESRRRIEEIGGGSPGNAYQNRHKFSPL